MGTLNDGLMSSLSLYSGTANDRLYSVLSASTVLPPAGYPSLNDLWATYLAEWGFTSGTLQERIWAWMNSYLATDGQTYNDTQYAFWNQGATVPPFPGALTLFDMRAKYTTLPALLTALNATYTRNSVKNVVQDGALVQLAANQFGTSYDPVTGLYGYVPEPAATNLCLYSAQLDLWASTRAAVTANAAVAPDGSATADKLIATAAAGNHKAFSASVTKAASAITYTASVFVKAAEYNFACIGFSNNTETSVVSVCVNLTTGGLSSVTATGSAVAGTALSEYIGNGWWRVSVTGTSDTDTIVKARIIASLTSNASGDPTAGNGVSGVYAWGAQLETGLRATSPIYTAGSTASRAADVDTVLLSSVPGFLASGYTLFADFRVNAASGSDKTLISVDDGTANNRARIMLPSSGGITTAVTVGGVDQASVNEGSVGTSRIRVAFSCSANSFLRAVNGVAGTADTSGSMIASPTTLRLGCRYDNTQQANACLFLAGLIPQALTQAQINALTVL